MTIRRRCTERNCKNPRRCLEHLRFDVMFQGKRYRIPANEFAIPRMEPGKQRPIQSLEEARDWERLFIGEIKAGRDPQRPPSRFAGSCSVTPRIRRFLPFALCRRLLAFAALWCAQRARKGQPPRHRLNRPRPRGSKRLPPAEAWKTGVVAVGSDPLAPRFDSQRGQPRILHQVPRRTRLPT